MLFSDLPVGSRFIIVGDDEHFVKISTMKLQGWSGPLLFNSINENEFIVECLYTEPDTEVEQA